MTDTLTIPQLKAKNKHVIDALKSVGVPASMYARPVNGKRNLAMSAQNGIVRIWPGEAGLTVAKDKAKKQIVLRSFEKARTWTENYENTLSYYGGGSSDSSATRTIENDTRNKWNLDRNDKVTVTDLKREEVKSKTYSDEIRYSEFKVTAKVRISRPKTDMTFLIGKDEEAPFICQLPHHVNTVHQAHELLRPKGVSRNALRQGEWFFVETTQKELDKIANYTKTHSYIRGPISLGGTTHNVTCGITIGNDVFVTGLVYDNRTGRHSELFLDGWYKAVRNNEVVNRSVTNAVTQRYWD